MTNVVTVAQEEAAYAQVERVLNSTTFRNTEVLRRLLKFLALKSIAGEADQLKEYTVGIDALGKPATYDPRQDSVVRIQMGRLRHKLADYYSTEGTHDPILLDLPKGHFKLTWEVRPFAVEEVPPVAVPVPQKLASGLDWQRIAVIVASAWAILATGFWYRQYREAAPLREAWTSDLQELWQPVFESNRPLIVAVSTPLFVGFQGSGFFRDQSLNTWEDALHSPRVQAIRRSLNNPAILQRYYYTGVGEMAASFRLGKLLNFSGLKMSTARSSQVSWQQMADNNVIFVGAPRVFGDQLHKLPVDLDLVFREDGVHDLKPPAGKPALYADDYPSIANEAASIPDDGEVYALVDRMPGPLGSGDIQTFTSNHSPGTLGAVEWFTNSTFAHQLLTKLRKADGTIPRYFQLVLKVKYQDAVPTQIHYVTHRELRPETPAASHK